ncbi:MAG TPA: efflux RND transporter periplasmic adaptor subunit [Gammaproteobacteria bacterium]|nr:efflux RND transporter periplasmic adaptor subunit [Gammaproteobacteria bacterium]
MPARSRRLASVLLVAIVAGVLIWRGTRPEPLAVIVQAVDRGTVEATVANTRAGTVKACRRARLAPAQGGQIARLYVREGDRVGAGQMLLELWNDDLTAQTHLAQSEADAARAAREQACLLAGDAEREAQRISRLRQQKLVAEEDADRAVTQAKASRASCRAAQANQDVARARLAVAEATLDRTRLRAPFEGIVAEVNGEVGEFVTPSPTGVATLPAVDLVDTRCLYVEAPIDEVDAPAIQPGLPVRIRLDAFAKKVFAGRVSRIAPYVLELEKQARTVATEVLFEDPADFKGLLPGFSADVEILLDVRKHVLRVPTEAVTGTDTVLVRRPGDGVLEARRVKTGLSNWTYTEILDGLQAGEQVVVSVDRAGVKPGAVTTVDNNARP